MFMTQTLPPAVPALDILQTVAAKEGFALNFDTDNGLALMLGSREVSPDLFGFDLENINDLREICALAKKGAPLSSDEANAFLSPLGYDRVKPTVFVHPLKQQRVEFDVFGSEWCLLDDGEEISRHADLRNCFH